MTWVLASPAPTLAEMHSMSASDSEMSPRFILQPPAAEMLPATEFTHQAIVRLIEAVGRRLDLYGSRERARLFHSVQQELEAQGHCLPVERIRRKWNNLIVTYKRVKDRSRETGQAKTSWEYYEMMDAMLGKTIGAHSSAPASVTLVDMATVAKATATTELSSCSNMANKPSLFPGGLMGTCAHVPSQLQPATHNGAARPPGNADALQPQLAAGPCRSRARPRLRGGASSSAAAGCFLSQQHGQAGNRTTLLKNFLSAQKEQGQLEEEQQRRVEAREKRREKREVRMTDALGRMAAALELVSSKQDTIIALLQRLADKP
nr:uncharacterized protein LOC111845215 isoform X1 [Paramormyrops kingsleyae]XP_023670218.1 uncharacterized protein LOC111845215 isoform X1 [Paramormyrops kingsleyae]XP_023670219.1 uncharacterized protein LOC111845215 isoform X1 [Paramormyrops kingsleyae]